MTVNSLQEAQETLEAYREIKAQIEKLMVKHGISDLQADADHMRKEATKWAVENDAAQIQLEGAHATLIRQAYGGHWIADDDDMDDATPKGTKSLREIIEKKFKSNVNVKGTMARTAWLKITKRVVDPTLVDAAVADGVLKLKEIESAYVEKEKAPYLRIFDDDV